MAAQTVSPDGGHVYVTAGIDHAVVVFARDPRTEGLTFVEHRRDGVGGVDGLEGASFVTVSSDGGNACLAMAYDKSVAVFQIHLILRRLRVGRHLGLDPHRS